MTQDGGGRWKDRKAASKPTPTDFSIMGTNDSSIVSKRSVEVLYHAEPHFFKHFVKKPKRRAPLINRGYWLRMRAIEYELLKFLRSADNKRKVVINLGCGYDPLPFQILSRYPEKTENVLFVDVDYPDLIRNKVAMIGAAPELMNMLDDVRYSETEYEALSSASNGTDNPEVTDPDTKSAPGSAEADALQFCSRQYAAIGCDLAKPHLLQNQLEKLLNLAESSFCFVAEVSVTYMKEKAADSLIRWASSIGDARFFQLEQCLPHGEKHPFAETMLKHFHKLGTRLRSLKNYPTARHQEERFRSRGWKTAKSQSLWKLWSSSQFMTTNEKKALDEVEPFDEWEEFALFASHYFILTAQTTGEYDTESDRRQISTDYLPSFNERSYSIARSVPVESPRSFASSFVLDSRSIGMYGGQGARTRLGSIEIVSDLGCRGHSYWPSAAGMAERSCQSVTSVGSMNGQGRHLLVGGRSSPDKALADCWLLSTKPDVDGEFSLEWEQVRCLPHGLYRHSVTALSHHSTRGICAVLVAGGKTGRSTISEKWYVWLAPADQKAAHENEWIELKIQSPKYQPRFGANLITLSSSGPQQFSGVLLGGMKADGNVCTEMLNWSVDLDLRSVAFEIVSVESDSQMHRFGAAVTSDEFNGDIVLTGGIHAASVEPEIAKPVVHLQPGSAGTMYLSTSESTSAFSYRDCPMLVGHTVTAVAKGRILIVGGGATCFSFGTYHNTTAWMIQFNHTDQQWKSASHGWQIRAPDASYERGSATSQVVPGPAPQKVQRLQPAALDFGSVVEAGSPCVLENLDLGPCTTKWSLSYLRGQIGPDREVIVHRSDHDAMDFQTKNFSYQKLPFQQFIEEIEVGRRHYLRALSGESGNKPANFWQDYSALADDFVLPEGLTSVLGSDLADGRTRLHSSVFRVSGPVSMWLHYDVMSNILCQIHGTKTLLLYPPTDVRDLGIAPGQSSSSLNMFDPATYAQHDLSKVRPLLVELKPGDVLFLPALWLHTAQPTSGTSIAVNVFFRDLESGYAAGRDVYGNRDLQAYEDGRRDIKRIEGRFAKLPSERKKFYLLRLAQEMQALADT